VNATGFFQDNAIVIPDPHGKRRNTLRPFALPLPGNVIDGLKCLTRYHCQAL
jgi:hypothetical protein